MTSKLKPTEPGYGNQNRRIAEWLDRVEKDVKSEQITIRSALAAVYLEGMLEGKRLSAKNQCTR